MFHIIINVLNSRIPRHVCIEDLLDLSRAHLRSQQLRAEDCHDNINILLLRFITNDGLDRCIRIDESFELFGNYNVVHFGN